MKGGVLRDRQANPVEFSVITNAGNLAREKMAAMIQQDLAIHRHQAECRDAGFRLADRAADEDYGI